MGVSDATVRRYADQLEGALVVQQLQPWHENISQRQVKAPKLYLRDSGLVHALLDIETREQLDQSPRSGASWEGFLLQQVTAQLRANPRQCHFWATHQGAELDLLVTDGPRRLGFEFKRTASPVVTPNMRSAMESLNLFARAEASCPRGGSADGRASSRSDELRRETGSTRPP